MRRPFPVPFIPVIAFVALPVAAFAQDARTLGRYRSSDGRVAIHLLPKGNQAEGELDFNGQRYRVKASLGSGALSGTFTLGKDAWPFTAQGDGARLSFRTGGQTVELVRLPLALKSGIYGAGASQVQLDLQGADAQGTARIEGRTLSFRGRLQADALECTGQDGAGQLSFRLRNMPEGETLRFEGAGLDLSLPWNAAESQRLAQAREAEAKARRQKEIQVQVSAVLDQIRPLGARAQEIQVTLRKMAEEAKPTMVRLVQALPIVEGERFKYRGEVRINQKAGCFVDSRIYGERSQILSFDPGTVVGIHLEAKPDKIGLFSKLHYCEVTLTTRMERRRVPVTEANANILFHPDLTEDVQRTMVLPHTPEVDALVAAAQAWIEKAAHLREEGARLAEQQIPLYRKYQSLLKGN